MSFRDQVWHKWHIRSPRNVTDEQRDEWRKKREAAQAKQEQERAQQAAEAADKSARVWAEAARDGESEYLTRKGFKASEIGVRISRGDVVVPMWRDGKIVGAQFIMPDGSKRFVAGCEKTGAYHAIPGDGDLLMIGEGLATMAAVKAALGCSVVIAFDAGNLKPVAEAMRLKYPDKRIAFAADGDQWTITGNKRPKDWDNPPGSDPRWNEWRDAGLCINTGLDKARQAAVAIGGAVVVSPPIPCDDDAKRTDWWDVWHDMGDEAVRAAFEAAMKPPPQPEYDPGYMDDRDYGDPVYDEPVSRLTISDQVRPLGHKSKMFYFYSRQAGEIVSHTAPGLAVQQNLIALAPQSVWEDNFGGLEKKNCAAAANALIASCMQAGIYNQDRERGVGIWWDGGRQVFNNGARLYYDGRSSHPADFRSDSVYVMGACVGDLVSDDMDNQDTAALLRICLDLTWKHKQMGYMLAGFIVSSLVSGATDWRSHIVVTGEKGAGKTWTIENIVKACLGKMALSRDGGSTSAKVRDDIGGNALTVIMDEAESETEKDRNNMADIFMMARKASSGAEIANFNGVYPIRSAFCFAAINPRITQGADLDRITFLHLKKDRREDHKARFKDMERRVSSLIDAGFSSRLLARVFGMVPVILSNIKTFSDVMTDISGSRRFGDQFGTLIAGAYALVSRGEISPEKAAEWCAQYSWDWATEENNQSDAEKLVEFILSSRVGYDDRGMRREATIAKLIDRAIYGDGIDQDAASSALGEYGIKADRDWIVIASPCQAFSGLLEKTQWTASYRRTLSELPGVEHRDKVRFNPGLRARAVAIPTGVMLGEAEAAQEVEIPFDDF